MECGDDEFAYLARYGGASLDIPLPHFLTPDNGQKTGQGVRGGFRRDLHHGARGPSRMGGWISRVSQTRVTHELSVGDHFPSPGGRAL